MWRMAFHGDIGNPSRIAGRKTRRTDGDMAPKRQGSTASIITSGTDSHYLSVTLLAAYVAAQVIPEIARHVSTRADFLRTGAIVPTYIHPTAAANDGGLYYLLGAGHFSP